MVKRARLQLSIGLFFLIPGTALANGVELTYSISQTSPTSKPLGQLKIVEDPGRSIYFQLLGERPSNSQSGSESISGADGEFFYLNSRYAVHGDTFQRQSKTLCEYAYIDGLNSLTECLRVPYLPGLWMPFATLRKTGTKYYARFPFDKTFQRVRIEGPINQPTQILYGCFPHLPDSWALGDYIYSNWVKVGKGEVPSMIAFQGVQITKIALSWTLIDARDSVIVPKTLSVRCDLVEDERILQKGWPKIALTSVSKNFDPTDVTAIADHNSTVLATLAENKNQTGWLSNTLVVIMALLGLSVASILTFAIVQVLKRHGKPNE